MLRALKLSALRLADSSGLESLILNSNWRKQRLLILCYHGLALEDEFEWRPNVYMRPAVFRGASNCSTSELFRTTARRGDPASICA